MAVYRRGSNVVRKYALPPAADLDKAAAAAAVEPADTSPKTVELVLLAEFLLPSPVLCGAVDPASAALCAFGTAAGEVILLDMIQGQPRPLPGGHHDEVTCMAFQGSKYLPTADAGGASHVYRSVTVRAGTRTHRTPRLPTRSLTLSSAPSRPTSLFPAKPSAHDASKLKHKSHTRHGTASARSLASAPGTAATTAAAGGGGGGGIAEALATDAELRLIESLPPDVPLPPKRLSSSSDLRLPIAKVSCLDSPALGLVQATSGATAVYDLEDGALLGTVVVTDQNSGDAKLAPLRLFEAACLSQGRGLGSRLGGFPQPPPPPPDPSQHHGFAPVTTDLELGSKGVVLSPVGAAQLGAGLSTASNMGLAMVCSAPAIANLPCVLEDATAPTDVGVSPLTVVAFFPAPSIALALCPGVRLVLGLESETAGEPGVAEPDMGQVVDVFTHLKPAQRRDDKLDVETLEDPTGKLFGMSGAMRTRAGLNSSMRSVNVHTPHPPNTPGFGNGSVGGRSTHAPLHAQGDGLASTAGSGPGSAAGGAQRQSRMPGSVGTPGSMVGSAMGSGFGDLTAENLGARGPGGAHDAAAGVTAAAMVGVVPDSYMPTSAYVWNSMQTRHAGRQRREMKLLERRNQLMAMLPS